jgi:hypothetical protein
MVQTIVVVILLAIDAWIVLTNPAAFQTSLALRSSQSAGQVYTVTIRMLMEAAGAALVIAWIAGLIDRAGLDRRVEQYERTTRVMSEEMMRTKARAYDEERGPLEDIRVRLDTLDRDIRGLRARFDREALAPAADTVRVAPAETRIIRDKTA